MILVNSSKGGDCWSFGVTLSTPMVYDEFGVVWMCLCVCIIMWESF